MAFTRKRVLVTGGAGFLGSHPCGRLLRAGDDVLCVDNHFFGNPTEATVLVLAELAIRLSGSRSKIMHQPLLQDDPLQRCPDITRIRELLGWEPKIGLETGLQRTATYFAGTPAGSPQAEGCPV